MGTKKVSYKELLKKAIAEYDTSKNVDVKGPFLDPILSYSGDGELPTHKDAASVLERYYFERDQDERMRVEVTEDTEPGISVPPKEENEIETGEDPDSVAATKSDIEKEVTEDTTSAPDTDGDSGTEQAAEKGAEGEVPSRKDDVDVSVGEQEVVDVDKEMEKEEEEGEEEAEEEKEAGEEIEEADAVEEAVIEKLIAEMEEEEAPLSEQEEPEEKEEEEKEEEAEVEEECVGVKKEQEEVPEEEEEKEEEEKEEEEEIEEAAGNLGGPPLAGHKDAQAEGTEAIDEAFQLFKEQIEADEEEEEEPEEVEEISTKDIQV